MRKTFSNFNDINKFFGAYSDFENIERLRNVVRELGEALLGSDLSALETSFPKRTIRLDYMVPHRVCGYMYVNHVGIDKNDKIHLDASFFEEWEYFDTRFSFHSSFGDDEVDHDPTTYDVLHGGDLVDAFFESVVADIFEGGSKQFWDIVGRDFNVSLNKVVKHGFCNAKVMLSRFNPDYEPHEHEPFWVNAVDAEYSKIIRHRPEFGLDIDTMSLVLDDVMDWHGMHDIGTSLVYLASHSIWPGIPPKEVSDYVSICHLRHVDIDFDHFTRGDRQ